MRAWQSTVWFAVVIGAGCGDEEAFLCASEEMPSGCVTTYRYEDGRLVERQTSGPVPGCESIATFEYENGRIQSINTASMGGVETTNFVYEGDVVDEIRIGPEPLVRIELRYDLSGYERGRTIHDGRPIEVEYALNGPLRMKEAWQADDRTAEAGYVYDDEDNLVRIDEHGFVSFAQWYMRDRRLVTPIVGFAEQWSVEMDYDDEGYEAERRWTTSAGDVLRTVRNTYGTCG